MEKVKEYYLSQTESQQISDIALDIIKKEKSSLNDIIENAKLLATDIPKSVMSFILNFRNKEDSLGICIKGIPMDDNLLGNTPERYFNRNEKQHCTREEIIFILFAEILGNVFAWNSIQNGNIINEIIPIEGNAHKPTSSGYLNDFGLHTEDAFSKYKGEYLALLGLRNIEKAGTTISYTNNQDLDDNLKKELFKKQFIIGRNIGQNVRDIDFESAILYGNWTNPYLNINLNNTKPTNDKAKQALTKLSKILKQNLFQYEIQQGDFFVLDNCKCVHGRSAYTPNSSAKSRWLKRLYITNDLRKSSEIRSSPASRLLISNTDLK